MLFNMDSSRVMLALFSVLTKTAAGSLLEVAITTASESDVSSADTDGDLLIDLGFQKEIIRDLNLAAGGMAHDETRNAIFSIANNPGRLLNFTIKCTNNNGWVPSRVKLTRMIKCPGRPASADILFTGSECEADHPEFVCGRDVDMNDGCHSDAIMRQKSSKWIPQLQGVLSPNNDVISPCHTNGRIRCIQFCLSISADSLIIQRDGNMICVTYKTRRLDYEIMKGVIMYLSFPDFR